MGRLLAFCRSHGHRSCSEVSCGMDLDMGHHRVDHIAGRVDRLYVDCQHQCGDLPNNTSNELVWKVGTKMDCEC